MEIKWGGGELEIEESPTWKSGVPTNMPFSLRASAGIWERTKQVAQEISAREGFRGFTVEDLRRIASAMKGDGGDNGKKWKSV